MLAWPLLQGRRIDGAPTLRIPSCAGECPSPLTSANTRLTEPRETRAHCRLDVNTRNRDTGRDTPRLDTASRFIQVVESARLTPARSAGILTPKYGMAS